MTSPFSPRETDIPEFGGTCPTCGHSRALKAQEKPVEVTVKEFNDLIDPQMPSFNNIGNLLLNRFPNGIKLIDGGA